MGITTTTDTGFWLIGIAGLGSLAATLLLLARWPRLRLRKG
jgi:hypothetical protein